MQIHSHFQLDAIQFQHTNISVHFYRETMNMMYFYYYIVLIDHTNLLLMIESYHLYRQINIQHKNRNIQVPQV